jgi:hypothetical protein
MAKQTFTTGQVLTAAQMTSLQQTAMLGGAASAKTASYTLVAADAGTAISMSNASATTITVNTALFAAGDTVQITNLGAGVCTITAGTATVNTSASLALAQYESGTLNFTSTSAAIFIKGAGASAVSGSNFTLLNAGGTALTGSSVTISGISAKDKIFIIIQDASSSSTFADLQLRINADTGNNYTSHGIKFTPESSYSLANTVGAFNWIAQNNLRLSTGSSAASGVQTGTIFINGANSTGVKVIQSAFGVDQNGGSQGRSLDIGAIYIGTSVVSSITVLITGTFNNGTVYVYTSA